MRSWISGRLASIVSWLAIIVAMTVALAPLIPPREVASSDGRAFSAVSAFGDIEQIAQEPHAMGSDANDRVRAKIVDRLDALGISSEIQAFDVPDYYSGRGGTVRAVNVIARIPGHGSTGAVALVSHYDSDPTTPGANDNAAAVAALLEAARAILVDDQLKNDVMLVFTDGEEPAPRFGSTAFVEDHPWAADIAFVINLEAIGGQGPSFLTGLAGSGQWVLDQYVQAVPYPVAYSYLTTTEELIGGSNTDFATFRDQDVPGVEFVYLHGSSIYHTAADNPAAVSLRSLQHHGANTLALARQVGNLDLTAPRQDSTMVFFTIGRFAVARYPAAWTLPVVWLTALVLAVAAVRQRHWRWTLRSFGSSLLAVMVSAAAMTGIWFVVGGIRTDLRVAESYVYLATMLGLTVAIGWAFSRLTKRPIGSAPDALGVVLLWWAFGLLISMGAPGIGYLFVWPALVASLMLLSPWPYRGPRWPKLVMLVPVAVTALVLMSPAIDTYYQLAQPRPGNPDSEILFVVAIPVMLFGLVSELIRAFRVRGSDPSDGASVADAQAWPLAAAIR